MPSSGVRAKVADMDVDFLAGLELVLIVPSLLFAVACWGGEGFKWWGCFWGVAMGTTSVFWRRKHGRR